MTVQARADDTPSFERPFDRFLLALRLCAFECRATPEPPADVHERAYAACPSCRVEGCLALEVVERLPGGEVELGCLSGCNDASVRRALVRLLCITAVEHLEIAA